MRLEKDQEDVRKGKALGCSDGPVVKRVQAERTRAEVLRTYWVVCNCL